MGQKASKARRGQTKAGGSKSGGGVSAAGAGSGSSSGENPDGDGGHGQVQEEEKAGDGAAIRETTEARFRQATGIVDQLAHPNPDPDANTTTLTMALPQNTTASAKVSEFIGNYLRREGSPLVKDELIAVAVALDPDLRIADVATMTLPELRRLIRSTLITHHIARAREQYQRQPSSSYAGKFENP